MSVCETDAAVGGAVTIAVEPETVPDVAAEAATHSSWLALGVDVIAVGEAGRSPDISSTVVGIDAPTTVVVAVVEIDAATVGAPRAHVTIGSVEVTAVPSRVSRSTISVQLPLARGRRSSSTFLNMS